MRIVYHGVDLDGKCSAAIVWHSVEARAARKRGAPCELIPLDYGQPLGMADWVEGEAVYVVDFSLPLQQMLVIAERYCLVWIDHHKTAIAEADAAGFDPAGRRLADGGEAACLLCWRYFHPGAEVPVAVRLLSDYDTWQNANPLRWHRLILPFQLGVRAQHPEPTSDFWHDLLDMDPRRAKAWAERGLPILVAQGGVILASLRDRNRELVTAAAFFTKLDGLSALACNALHVNSGLFDDAIGRMDVSLFIAFGWQRDHWKLSLWPAPAAKALDVSAIAKKYGGGGHAGAAGCQCAELPFRLPGAPAPKEPSA